MEAKRKDAIMMIMKSTKYKTSSNSSAPPSSTGGSLARGEIQIERINIYLLGCSKKFLSYKHDEMSHWAMI